MRLPFPARCVDPVFAVPEAPEEIMEDGDLILLFRDGRSKRVRSHRGDQARSDPVLADQRIHAGNTEFDVRMHLVVQEPTVALFGEEGLWALIDMALHQFVLFDSGEAVWVPLTITGEVAAPVSEPSCWEEA